MTVAFYVQNEDRDKDNIKSTIKFGSMDKVGIVPGSKLELIRTKDKTTWDINCKEAFLDGLNIASESLVRFDP